MAQGTALQQLVASRQVWHGHAARTPALGEPTGFTALDAALPLGGWPEVADHAALRRLQVAAEHGQTLGFVLRHQRHAAQGSPAALRLQWRSGDQVQVLKCRGGAAPAQLFDCSAGPALPLATLCSAPARPCVPCG